MWFPETPASMPRAQASPDSTQGSRRASDHQVHAADARQGPLPTAHWASSDGEWLHPLPNQVWIPEDHLGNRTASARPWRTSFTMSLVDWATRKSPPQMRRALAFPCGTWSFTLPVTTDLRACGCSAAQQPKEEMRSRPWRVLQMGGTSLFLKLHLGSYTMYIYVCK